MKKQKLDLKYAYLHGKNKTLVVICNGHGATIEHPSVKKIMAELLKKGFSSVCFDYLDISVTQMVKDTETTIKYFSQYKKIYVMGVSLGAISAVITSIVNPKVNALITINGFFGKFKLGLGQSMTYLGYRFMTLIKSKHRKDYQYFKDNFKPEKLKIPALIIYTKADKVVSPSQSVDFFKSLETKNKKLTELPLLKHNLRGNGDVGKVVNEINDWKNNFLSL